MTSNAAQATGALPIKHNNPKDGYAAAYRARGALMGRGVGGTKRPHPQTDSQPPGEVDPADGGEASHPEPQQLKRSKSMPARSDVHPGYATAGVPAGPAGAMLTTGQARPGGKLQRTTIPLSGQPSTSSTAPVERSTSMPALSHAPGTAKATVAQPPVVSSPMKRSQIFKKVQLAAAGSPSFNGGPTAITKPSEMAAAHPKPAATAQRPGSKSAATALLPHPKTAAAGPLSNPKRAAAGPLPRPKPAAAGPHSRSKLAAAGALPHPKSAAAAPPPVPKPAAAARLSHPKPAAAGKQVAELHSPLRTAPTRPKAAAQRTGRGLSQTMVLSPRSEARETIMDALQSSPLAARRVRPKLADAPNLGQPVAAAKGYLATAALPGAADAAHSTGANEQCPGAVAGTSDEEAADSDELFLEPGVHIGSIHHSSFKQGDVLLRKTLTRTDCSDQHRMIVPSSAPILIAFPKLRGIGHATLRVMDAQDQPWEMSVRTSSGTVYLIYGPYRDVHSLEPDDVMVLSLGKDGAILVQLEEQKAGAAHGTAAAAAAAVSARTPHAVAAAAAVTAAEQAGARDAAAGAEDDSHAAKLPRRWPTERDGVVADLRPADVKMDSALPESSDAGASAKARVEAADRDATKNCKVASDAGMDDEGDQEAADGQAGSRRGSKRAKVAVPAKAHAALLDGKASRQAAARVVSAGAAPAKLGIDEGVESHCAAMTAGGLGPGKASKEPKAAATAGKAAPTAPAQNGRAAKVGAATEAGSTAAPGDAGGQRKTARPGRKVASRMASKAVRAGAPAPPDGSASDSKDSSDSDTEDAPPAPGKKRHGVGKRAKASRAGVTAPPDSSASDSEDARPMARKKGHGQAGKRAKGSGAGHPASPDSSASDSDDAQPVPRKTVHGRGGKNAKAGPGVKRDSPEEDDGEGDEEVVMGIVAAKHVPANRGKPKLWTGKCEPGTLPKEVDAKFTARTILVNQAGKQLTKSCHICQNQHFLFKCKKGRADCTASYCKTCAAHHFKKLTWEEIMECCPKCRGTCSCKQCLRKMDAYTPPDFTAEQRKEYARYVLRCVAPAILEFLTEAERQAMEVEHKALEDVHFEPPADQQRVLCDACATSICDYHWRCKDCLNGAPAAKHPPKRCAELGAAASDSMHPAVVVDQSSSERRKHGSTDLAAPPAVSGLHPKEVSAAVGLPSDAPASDMQLDHTPASAPSGEDVAAAVAASQDARPTQVTCTAEATAERAEGVDETAQAGVEPPAVPGAGPGAIPGSVAPETSVNQSGAAEELPKAATEHPEMASELPWAPAPSPAAMAEVHTATGPSAHSACAAELEVTHPAAGQDVPFLTPQMPLLGSVAPAAAPDQPAEGATASSALHPVTSLPAITSAADNQPPLAEVEAVSPPRAAPLPTVVGHAPEVGRQAMASSPADQQILAKAKAQAFALIQQLRAENGKPRVMPACRVTSPVGASSTNNKPGGTPTACKHVLTAANSVSPASRQASPAAANVTLGSPSPRVAAATVAAVAVGSPVKVAVPPAGVPPPPSLPSTCTGTAKATSPTEWQGMFAGYGTDSDEEMEASDPVMAALSAGEAREQHAMGSGQQLPAHAVEGPAPGCAAHAGLAAAAEQPDGALPSGDSSMVVIAQPCSRAAINGKLLPPADPATALQAHACTAGAALEGDEQHAGALPSGRSVGVPGTASTAATAEELPATKDLAVAGELPAAEELLAEGDGSQAKLAAKPQAEGIHVALGTGIAQMASNGGAAEPAADAKGTWETGGMTAQVTAFPAAQQHGGVAVEGVEEEDAVQAMVEDMKQEVVPEKAEDVNEEAVQAMGQGTAAEETRQDAAKEQGDGAAEAKQPQKKRGRKKQGVICTADAGLAGDSQPAVKRQCGAHAPVLAAGVKSEVADARAAADTAGSVDADDEDMPADIGRKHAASAAAGAGQPAGQGARRKAADVHKAAVDEEPKAEDAGEPGPVLGKGGRRKAVPVARRKGKPPTPEPEDDNEEEEDTAEGEVSESEEVDMCMRCYHEQAGSPTGVCCPRCHGSRFGMASFLERGALQTLRKIVEEYGQQDERPTWRWLDSSVPAAAQDARKAQEARQIGVSSAPAAPPAGSGRTLQVWGRTLAVEDVRLAAVLPGGERRYLYTPHWDSLRLDLPGRAAAMEVFLERWQEGEPIIVRGCRQRMSWDPRTMARCTHDRGSKKFHTTETGALRVLDCAGFKLEEMTQQAFFDGFQNGVEDDRGRLRMLKVKDWPQDERFQDRLKRHHQDFLEMLPCPEYTHPDPRIAPLNLAGMLPPHANATDLGPKTYIAYGRPEEHEEEGDSVTKMHQDMSDAINVLTYVQYADDKERSTVHVRCGEEASTASWGNAGAVWDIARREDVPQLRGYLEDNKADFVHKGKKLSEPKAVGDVIFDHSFMLKQRHHDALAKNGMALWRFEQHENEGVFIPAGCPHAVRNLRSCVKIAVDFVSPESVGECRGMADLLRRCSLAHDNPRENAPHERYYHDKLQARQMVLWGAIDAYNLVSGQTDAGAGQSGGAAKRGGRAGAKQGGAKNAPGASAQPLPAKGGKAGQKSGKGVKRQRQ